MLSFFEKKGEKHIDTIMAQPLTGIRLTLAEAFMKGQLSDNDFRKIVAVIVKKNRNTPHSTLNAQIKQAVQALKTGAINGQPYLDTPETQLLWGATLTFLACHPELKDIWPESRQNIRFLHDTQIWKELVNSPRANTELYENAYHINEGIRNPSVKLRWGEPGSWYFFNPENNTITSDFVFSLISGFEHSRAVGMHEVGHSQLTVAFPRYAQEAKERIDGMMAEMQAKNKQGGKVTKEEYIQLVEQETKLELLMKLFNPCEDNCVNRYAANMGNVLPQDYSLSVNNTYVTTSGGGMVIRANRKNKDIFANLSDAEKKFQNICNVISLVFYSNNELFKKDSSEWRRFSVRQDWIQSNARNSAGALLNNKESFDRLIALAAQFEALQPAPTDRIYGKEYYNQKVADTMEKRSQIMMQIWDEYTSDLARQIIEERKKAIKELIDKIAKGMPVPTGMQAKPGEGLEIEGVGNMPGAAQTPETPQEGKKGGQGKLAESEWNEQPDAQKGAGKGQDSKDGKNKKEKGEGKAGDKTENTDADNKNNPGSASNNQPKTIEELLENKSKAAYIKDVENDEKAKDKNEAKNSEKPKPTGSSGRAGSDHGKRITSARLDKIDDLEKDYDYLSVADLGQAENYAQRKLEMAPAIGAIAKIMKKITEKLTQQTMEMGKELEMLPDDGSLDRFDSDAHQELIRKRLTRQPVTQDDLRRFKRDTIKTTHPKPKLIILLDNSGSTYHNTGYQGESRLDIEATIAITAREAAKAAGWDTSVYDFGGIKPHKLITATDDETQNQSRFAGATLDVVNAITRGQHIGCGNEGCPTCRVPQEYLSRGLKAVVNDLSSSKLSDGEKPADDVFILILSDGQIHDMHIAKTILGHLIKASKRIHIDAAVVSTEAQTLLDSNLEASGRYARTGIVHVYNTSDVEDTLKELFQKRLLSVTPIAVDDPSATAGYMQKILRTIVKADQPSRR